jgi:serine protease Do
MNLRSFVFVAVAGIGGPFAVTATAQPASLAAFSDALQRLAERVGPSIVQINVSGFVVPPPSANGASLLERQRSSGSGVIVEADGYIITNHHVVAGARRVQVLMPASARGTSIVRQRGRLLDATVVGLDEETDLAVLKVNASSLPTLRLSDSDLLRAGQVVCAFGSPLGLDNSVTMGVVSAVGRQLEADHPMVYVQTDAPINPGSSGGALVDIEGRVVGINTLILSQSGGNEGLGFAVPANIVRTVYTQIRKSGRVRRGVIGVSAQTITPAMAAALKLPQDSGVILGDVAPGGPGERAGLRPGDIALSLDDRPVENGRQFDVKLYQRSVGEVVTLEILRGGERVKVSVAVAERQDDAMRFSEMVSPERNLVERLGILALDLDERLAAAIGGLRGTSGVLVAARSMLAGVQYGLLPGDVILSVNGAPVRTLADLRSTVGRLPTNAPCALQVQRQGRLMFVAFEVE